MPEPGNLLDAMMAQVELVMRRYGYPSDPDGEEREPVEEIPLLKVA